MNILRDLVLAQSDTLKLQVIDDYEQYEKTGSTGHTALRILANEFCEKNDHSYAHITLFMDRIAMECYRYFANRWREEHKA